MPTFPGTSEILAVEAKLNVVYYLLDFLFLALGADQKHIFRVGHYTAWRPETTTSLSEGAMKMLPEEP